MLLFTCSILINLRIFPHVDGVQVIDISRSELGSKENS